MGVRIRRIAPVCAVVATLATGCMVGPTIADEKKNVSPEAPKSERGSPTGNPADLPDKNVPGATVPGATGPAAIPTGPAPSKATHTFRKGVTATVLSPTVIRSTPGPGGDVEYVDVGVPVRYLNRSGISLTADLLGVSLRAGAGPCGPARVGPQRSGPERVDHNSEIVLTYNFAVRRVDLGKVSVQVQPFLGGMEKFDYDTTVATPDTGPTRPAEGPSTQPTTRIVPRSTPTGSPSGTPSDTASSGVPARG